MAMNATLVADMVARHQPFAWVVGTIAEQQGRMAAVADILNTMSVMMAGPDYAQDPRWAAEIERDSDEVYRHVCEYLELLQTMRLQMLEAGHHQRWTVRKANDFGGTASRCQRERTDSEFK